MDYETSPTMKLENEAVTSEDTQSEKTGSEGSDGFVKVDEAFEEENQKTPTTEELSPVDDVKPVVETIPSSTPQPEKTSNLETALNDCLEPKVVDLLFWRDVKMSSFVFTMSLLVLLSLRFFSVLTVGAYLALSLLTVTISIRLYKFVLQTLNGSQQPNPFQQFLDADVTLSQEHVDKYVVSLLGYLNKTVATTRDLLLVKSVVSSLKFGLLMWLLTYIGCCMNGLTILTAVVLLAFALPPVYEKYQEPIDAYHGMACSKISQVVATIKSKVPGSKPKTQ